MSIRCVSIFTERVEDENGEEDDWCTFSCLCTCLNVGSDVGRQGVGIVDGYKRNRQVVKSDHVTIGVS